MSCIGPNSSSSGIGILGLLGIVFVTLKLTGYITWSWWWVTAPFWGGLAIVMVVGLVAAIVAMIIAGLDQQKRGSNV